MPNINPSRQTAAMAALSVLACSALLDGRPARATTVPAIERHANVVFAQAGMTLSPPRAELPPESTLIIVFHIRNASSIGRRLIIGNYRSPLVPPGRTRSYSVGFIRNGPVRCRALPGQGSAFARTLTIS